MSEEQINRIFSTGQLEAYISGGGTATERHAIESAALEDPFLADAIEGLQQARSSGAVISLPTDISELKERLEQPGRRRGITRWWRIAAAVLLLLCAGTAAYLLSVKTARPIANEVAVTKEAAPTTAPQEKTKSAEPVTIDSEAKVETAAAPAHTKAKIILPRAKPTDLMPVAIQRETRQQDKAASHEMEDTARRPRAALSTSGAMLSGRAAGLTIQPAQAAGPVPFRGVVVNERDRPIADAIVRLRKQSTETSTDSIGGFTVSAPNDSLLIADVVAVGYQPATVRLKANDPKGNRILLKPLEMSLMDEVVTGYSARKKAADEEDAFSPDHSVEAKKISPSNPNVIPVVGWVAFNTYLRNHRAGQSADSSTHGEQLISFLVDGQGNLSSFRVELSVSQAQDQETIRLIQTGPAWKILKGRKQRAVVEFSF